MTNPPVAYTIEKWLRANLGAKVLGALTGTDRRALLAAVQLIELYAYDAEPRLLTAFGTIVHRMQPGTRYLAYHSIAHVLDWGTRHAVWRDAGLELLTHIPRCAHGPA